MNASQGGAAPLNSVPLPEHKEEVSTRKVDPELSAMKRIGNILDDLDSRQARRVLGWALDKYIRSQNELAGDNISNTAGV